MPHAIRTGPHAGHRTPWPLRRALALALVCLLQACASLAPRPVLVPEQALTGDGTSMLVRLAAAGPAPGLSGLRLLPDGGSALDARLALVRHAERSLDLQYYLFRCDEVGLGLLAALGEAARRGVRVRLLVDDLHVDGDDAHFAAFARQPNVQVRMFNPLPVRGASVGARLLGSLGALRRVNHRMHNKLFIADGAASVSGGRNIGREYFMQDGDANFIDMDVFALGPVVQAQSASFDRYWNSEHAYPIAALLPAGAGAVAPAAASAAGWPPTAPGARDPLGRRMVSEELADATANAGTGSGPALFWAPASVVADLPEKIARPEMAARYADSVTQGTLAMIGNARERVVIISPYFIPGEVGLALMRDAQQRGVRTTVLTNAIGATDEPLVHFAYAGYRRRMLTLGVHIYELGPDIARRLKRLGNFGRSQGRLHAKMAIVDGALVYIGSMNMDERSAHLNTEIGLRIDSPALAADFGRLMDGDHFRSAYQVRLSEAGALQWVDRDDAGQEEVLDAEPGLTPFMRLRRWLLTPWLPEDQL